MCTVIYIPAKEGPLFSSCRDEDPARDAAWEPQIIEGETGLLVYPKDAAANGTWIGLHEKGHTVILLNGAFDNHVKKNSYKKSRGLIVTAILDSINPLEKWQTINLDNIEPFTLVVWFNQQLFQLVWDEHNKYEKKIPSDAPFIWSSVTLYDPEDQQLRWQWFNNAIKYNSVSTAKELLEVLNFYNEPQNGFVMKRNEQIQTLSISLIQFYPQHCIFKYHDCRNLKDKNIWMKQMLPSVIK